MLHFITAANTHLYDTLQEIATKYNALETFYKEIVQIETIAKLNDTFVVILWYKDFTQKQTGTYQYRYTDTIYSEIVMPQLDKKRDIKIT